MTEATADHGPDQLQYLQMDDIEFMTKAMRGIKSAHLRFFQSEKDFEDELIALLLALEVSVQSERVARIAPAPLRRYSLQFTGGSARITVTQGRPVKS